MSPKNPEIPALVQKYTRGKTTFPVTVSGLSGAVVCQVPYRGSYLAIKYFPDGNKKPRVPIPTQVENHGRLVQLFGQEYLPRLIDSDEQAMVMEAKWAAPNFSEAVIRHARSDSFLQKQYSRIIEKFFEVWRSTGKPYSTATRLTRPWARRAQNARRAALGFVHERYNVLDCLQYEVVVNGDHKGRMGDLLDKMESQYTPPSRTVVCHGDPNADNFISLDDTDPAHWLLIDSEWVGTHDPRFCASYFISWWLATTSRLSREPVLEVSRRSKTLRLSYEISQGTLTTPLIERGRQAARDLSVMLQDASVARQVNLQVATTLLCEMRLSARRGRSGYEIPLLGGGLRMLADL